MKHIRTAILAAALIAPAAAHADFIALDMRGPNDTIGFTDAPCADDPGHQVLHAVGGRMIAGCYWDRQDGGGLLVRWQGVPAESMFEFIPMSQVTKGGRFKKWPEPDWTKSAAQYQSTRK